MNETEVELHQLTQILEASQKDAESRLQRIKTVVAVCTALKTLSQSALLPTEKEALETAWKHLKENEKPF